MGSGVWVKNSWDWKGNSSVQDEILNFGGRFCNLKIWTFQVWEKSPLEQWCKTSLRKKQKEIEAKCFHASKKLQYLKSKLSLLQKFRYSKPFFGPCDYCNRQIPFSASAHQQILLQIPFKNRINNKRTGLEARFLISPRLHVNSQRYNNLYMKVVRKWTYQFSPSSP